MESNEEILIKADDLGMEIKDWLDYLEEKNILPKEINEENIIWGSLTVKDVHTLISALFTQLQAILENMSKSDASSFKKIVARTRWFIVQSKG